MSNPNPFVAVWSPRVLGILRIVLGFLFVQHGSAKLLGVPHQAMFDNLQVFSLVGTAGILELVGGALFLIGLCTRPVAFVLSGLMAFAYFIAHAGAAFLPMLNGGELAVIYCFVFLYFSLAGAGAYSIDGARAK